MKFQVTVRHGARYQRYHAEADLVELRPTVDPEERAYLGEEEG